MTEKNEAVEEVTAVAEEKWVCRHCNHTNSGEVEHCENCAFHKDYDPEATPEVDFSSVQAKFAEEEHSKRANLQFYFQAATAVTTLLILVAVIVMGVFLSNNWPFQQAYIQDANSLADAVLALQARVELGITLEEYDNLLVPLMTEKTKFKAIYSERKEHRLESYQKLTQAAEYFEIGREAWEQTLVREDNARRANPHASSRDAGDDVKKLWSTAAANLLVALEDLR